MSALNPSTSDIATAPWPPRFWWLKRGGGILLVGFILLALLWTWRLHQANAALQAQIDAIRTAHEPLTPEDLIGPSIPDSQNAALVLRQAADAITSDREPEDRTLLKQWVKDNAPALALVRRARGLYRADWRLPYAGPMVARPLSDLNQQRGLAHLIAEAEDVAWRDGDRSEAVEYIQDLCAMQRAMDQMPGEIPDLVAIGIGATALAPIETSGGELVPTRIAASARRGPAVRHEQLRALKEDLLDDRADRAALLAALCTERVARLDSMRRADDGTLRPGLAIGLAPVAERLLLLLYRPIIWHHDAAGIRYATGVLRAARSGNNFPTVRSLLPQPPSGRRCPPELVQSRIDISRWDVAQRFIEIRFQLLAIKRLVATALAIRLCQSDHGGECPSALLELIPTYLDRLPIDPFDQAGHPIRLALDRPLRLYSVWVDGRDDGGDSGLDPASYNQVASGAKDLVFRLESSPEWPPSTEAADPSTEP